MKFVSMVAGYRRSADTADVVASSFRPSATIAVAPMPAMATTIAIAKIHPRPLDDRARFAGPAEACHAEVGDEGCQLYWGVGVGRSGTGAQPVVDRGCGVT